MIHILIVLFDAYPNYTLAESKLLTFYSSISKKRGYQKLINFFSLVGQGLSRELFIGLALIYPISLGKSF